MEVSRDHLRHGKRSPQLVESWKQQDSTCYFYCKETWLEVFVIEGGILRFRFSPEARFDADFSYAISRPDPVPNTTTVDFTVKEVGDEFHIQTDKVLCRVTRTLHISIFDLEGNLLSEDERGYHWEPHPHFGGHIVYCSKKIQEQECFFGLGDKPDRLNLRGSRYETWGRDAYGFERTSDPLYKNIPFYLGLHHGLGYGIFFDNSFRTRFDFGYERSDVMSFWSKGGEMNYYFIYGPDLLQVVEGYSRLTGTPELPPLWALGYQQSKWSYYPESTVKELAARFRKEKIPCDVIHLDIDYMDGFRCFTWDKTRFPNPHLLVKELESDGFKTVLILDPGIKIDKGYHVYEEGLEGGYFCRRADGPLMRGDVWPGPCHFPDFTDPVVREWWAGQFPAFLESGVHGIWNDMNEPAVLEIGTFPADTRHDYDGHPCSHRKAHNVYGMQMARASYHGTKGAIYPRRPFLLTRSGYSGVQRYAAVWTGDNLSTWEHMWMANVQVQRMSVSGLSFAGSDIGGFIGQPNGELLTRWTQMGVFHPLFRNHASGDHGDQEPWSFGEPYTSAIRKAIELRYKLLPYIYTVFWRQVEKGTPFLRPLSFIDQKDKETYYRMEEFGVGGHLVVCPIHGPGQAGRRMYLPKGEWYHYWDDKPQQGGEEFWVEAPLDQIPVFVKAGAILPQYPVMQHTKAQRLKVQDLHIYYGEGPCTSELYEDSGEFYDYELGNFMVRTFTLQKTEEGVRIDHLHKGRYNASYTRFRFILHGFPFEPQTVWVGEEEVGIDRTAEGLAVFEAEKYFRGIRVLE